MKILVVSNTYPRNEKDNTVVFLKTLYNGMAALNPNDEIHIIAAQDDNDVDEEFDNDQPVTIHRFKYFLQSMQKLAYGDAIMSNLYKTKINYLLIPFFFIAMFLKTYKVSKKISPDIIHAHWIIPCGLVAVILKVFHKTPVMVTSHGGDIYSFKSYWLKKLIKSVIDRSDCINPVSHPIAEEFDKLNIHHKNLWVKPMGVDSSKFYFIPNAKSQINVPANKKIILFVGRLSEKKGINILLEALEKISLEDYKCLIIGSGNLEVDLKAKSQKLNLSDKVSFVGSVPNDELKTYYSAADLLVVPSIESIGGKEGLPVTFMEGLLCNCSILASYIGGMKYYGHLSSVRLLEPGNVGELKNAIEDFFLDYDNTSNYDRSKGPNEGFEFKIKEIAKQYIEKYKELI